MGILHQSIIGLIITISLNPAIILAARTFELDGSWPDNSIPNHPYYGSGITIDQENNIIVLHRSNAMLGPRNETIKENVVLVLDRTSGKILREWGKDMFYHPHGIEVAGNGDIFITDSKLHQVFKFEFQPTTKLWKDDPILTLGERFMPGNDTTHFCTPADVAIEPGTENIFVADGYCNRRVVKFDKAGKYLLEFSAGSSNNAIPIVPFNIVHSLTIAVRHSVKITRTMDPTDILIFVADRDNCRIQCFNSNGTFLYEITHERLGIAKRMLFSVVHVDVNPMNPPYNANFTSEFGIVYAVNGNLPDGSPKVFEIGVSGSNASVLSSFDISSEDMIVPLEAPHDLTASKDGKEVYAVLSNSSTLTLRRYTMKVENSVGRKYAGWEILIITVGIYVGSSFR